MNSHGILTGFREFTRNSRGNHTEFTRNSHGILPEIAWKSQKHHENPGKTQKLHGNHTSPGKSQKLRGKYGNRTKNHTELRVNSHEILTEFRKFTRNSEFTRNLHGYSPGTRMEIAKITKIPENHKNSTEYCRKSHEHLENHRNYAEALPPLPPLRKPPRPEGPVNLNLIIILISHLIASHGFYTGRLTDFARRRHGIHKRFTRPVTRIHTKPPGFRTEPPGLHGNHTEHHTQITRKVTRNSQLPPGPTHEPPHTPLHAPLHGKCPMAEPCNLPMAEPCDPPYGGSV